MQKENMHCTHKHTHVFSHWQAGVTLHMYVHRSQEFAFISCFSCCFQNLTEVSIDSGRGTMATVTTLSSRMSNNPRQRPMPAIHQYQSQIPEDRENSVGDSDRSGGESSHSGNFLTRKGVPNGPMPSAVMRHPPSPPVRLRDR